MIEATPRNMRKYAREPYEVGEATVCPVPLLALDLATGETWSAAAGDHFWLAEDEPLRGEDGEPLMLVFERTEIVHADDRTAI